MFEGEIISNITATITWSTDGGVRVSDNRGYTYSMSIPVKYGSFTLLENSTTIDQKFIGPDLQYDVYWWPIKNQNGFIDKYEFAIAGSSVGNSTISFDVNADKDSNQKFNLYKDALIVSNDLIGANSTDTLNNETAVIDWSGSAYDDKEPEVDGIGINWSDAVSWGYRLNFNPTESTIEMPVNGSFFIDPYIVLGDTQSIRLSPPKSDSFENENRIIALANDTATRIYAFYTSGSAGNPKSVKYKTSDDHGKTWSSIQTPGTGVSLGDDEWRYTIESRIIDETQYVFIFYFQDVTSTNVKFYVMRGVVNGLAVTWDPKVQIYSTSYDGYNAKANSAVVIAFDSDENIYAAYRWLPTASGPFSYRIFKSTDAGVTWSTSLTTKSGEIDTMFLAKLDGLRMIFGYASDAATSFFYKIFDGTTWGAEQTLTAVPGLTVDESKQISSISDDEGNVYLAYTQTAGQGIRIAKFFGNGTFDDYETASTTTQHRIPTILFDRNGNLNIITVHETTGAGARIWNTKQVNGIWEAPYRPYGNDGSDFGYTDKLTAELLPNGEIAVLFNTGYISPVDIKFALEENGTVAIENAVQNSPGYADYFEGERRVASNINGTLFAFYYDGSNIVYKKSFDDGHSWTGIPTSTGTGPIASDTFRWSIAHTVYAGEDRISLLYYTYSNPNSLFYQKTFKAKDSGLELVSTVNSFSAPNDASCSPTGVCAAAAGSSDASSNLYAAYRWKSSGTWHYKILKSTDGGSTWSTAVDTVDVTNTSNLFPITLTYLNSTRMLFAYATYESGDIYYRIFDGSSWGSVNTISAGISTNTVKQISSDTVDLGHSHGSMTAYVAFLASGNQGILKVAKFSTTGSFQGIETADTTQWHWTPATSVSADGVLHIYTMDDGTIYDTIKNQTLITNPGFELAGFDLDDAPVGYWKLENETFDFSLNGNDGTIVGDTLFVDGLDGFAKDFDGIDDYVEVAQATSISLANDFTVSIWAKIDATPSSWAGVINKGSSGTPVNYRIYISTVGTLHGEINDGTNGIDLDSGVSAVGAWHHVALVRNTAADLLLLYVDGVLKASATDLTTAVITNTNALRMGTGNSYLDGQIDDVRIYNRVLTLQEIQTISTGWDLRGGAINVLDPITGQMDLVRPGAGDTRSIAVLANVGKLYTVEADVLVTSGNARIDLVFVDGNGAWLTQDAVPVNGAASTSTTGSIQHLSASWIAPTNTVSMLVRLLNDGPGGSSRFDNIRVTSWQTPFAPYGTDLYYPDQLTAQIANPFTSSVLYRSGSTSPYSLMFAGQVGGEVATKVKYQLSPKTDEFYEGEKRLLKTSKGYFAFYYDGSNIMYKFSKDGHKWGKAKSTNSGKINNDATGWTISVTEKYVTIFYHKKSGSNTDFYANRAAIIKSFLLWDSARLYFTAANNSGCSNSVCAGEVASTDSKGNMFVAIRWKPSGSSSNFKYQVFKSSDAFKTLPSVSLSTTDSGSSSRLSMALTNLASGKMLFAYLRYDTSSIYYRVYDGSSWGSVLTTPSAGLSINTKKQVSAASDSTGKPYLAFITGGTGGTLKVVTWTKNGNSPTIQTVDSTKSHSLPSIMMFYDAISIYTVSGGSSISKGKVLLTTKVFETWLPPRQVYPDKPKADQLTVGLAIGNEYPAAIWTEGSSSYTIKVNGILNIIADNLPHEGIGIIISFGLKMCGGGFIDPHERTEEIGPIHGGVFKPTLQEMRDYMLGEGGYHDVSPPWGAPGLDYSKPISYAGCSDGEMRSEARGPYLDVDNGWYFEKYEPEPNPELNTYTYDLWWAYYVWWWHKHYSGAGGGLY